MKIEEYYRKYSDIIDAAIDDALKEDKVKQDITTSLYFYNSNQIVKAELVCKEFCLLAGYTVFKRVFNHVYGNFKFKDEYEDGDRLRPGSVVTTITGPVNKILIAERCALNFLQRMSGVATLTSRFVTLLRFKNAAVLHTRKTTPNFRVFEIGAVLIGGGEMHRFDLSTAVMVKDNHIHASGSVTEALKILKENSKRHKCIIEVKDLDEINEVVQSGKGVIDVVMLDNFNVKNTTKAIKILKDNGFKIEISGGLNINNFSKRQHRGIDYYSIGAITHSYSSVDFSLDF